MADIPPAEGVRITWDQLAASQRSAIEERLGARVVEAESRPGGFSPGLASRVRTADGRDVFLKVVSSTTNPDSVRIHRREARVAAALPPVPECPRLRWVIDEGTWVALAFDFIDGTTPALPWCRDDLDRVLGALTELSDSLTPSPVAVESAGELLGATLMRWGDVTARPEELARITPAWRRRVEELAELERRWPALAGGNSLVHLDVRADNVLLNSDRVYFVDWPWAAVGARWLDLVALLPSVAMQGGPDPESVWRAHPFSRGVSADAVDCFLAGLAGMFTLEAQAPSPPGLPTLRAFQGAQGRAACAWLAQRRGWSP